VRTRERSPTAGATWSAATWSRALVIPVAGRRTAPLVGQERRRPAGAVPPDGVHRAASLYNLLSQCEAFGLGTDDAKAVIESMLGVVSGWREFFAARGVEARSIEMLEQAMLPESFHRDAPAQAV
jgi:serine/threonine-protein kinase HipA